MVRKLFLRKLLWIIKFVLFWQKLLGYFGGFLTVDGFFGSLFIVFSKNGFIETTKGLPKHYELLENQQKTQIFANRAQTATMTIVSKNKSV